MKWKLAALGTLVALGLALEALQVIDVRAGLEWARGREGGWRLAAAIVAAQLALFTLAQPGSAMFWVAALLYPPVTATAILTAGATGGALGGYLLARRLARGDLERARKQRLVRLLERNGDFLTLCALRVAPGVPHALINYGAGALALPLPPFVAATVLGIALKSYVYAAAVAAAIDAATPRELLRPEVLAPLVAIAALLVLARLALSRRADRRAARSPNGR